MGDTVNGMNVSFIDHLNVAFSAGAVLLLLLVIGAFCACRKGMCLKWILGKRFMHMHQPPATPTSLPCPTMSISMPAIASAPTQPSDPVDQEIAEATTIAAATNLYSRNSELLIFSGLPSSGKMINAAILLASFYISRKVWDTSEILPILRNMRLHLVYFWTTSTENQWEMAV